MTFFQIIDVSQNNITEIQKQAFKDLFLTKINISHNRVEKIANFAFENCANITLLDLSYNEIRKLERDVFDSTTYATELQFSFNYFTDMSQVSRKLLIPLSNLIINLIISDSSAQYDWPKNTQRLP